jgi:hypothetical protein
VAQRRKGRAQIRRAGQRSRAHQRLLFPGPGALLLVLGEAFQARHQHALGAVRAQAHVDFVQAAGSGLGAEQRHQLLRHAREIAWRLERPRAVRHRIGTGVVQEHQVEVGIEAEFAPADAAVADHREAGAGDAPVRGFQFALRQRQHRHHHFLRQRRQQRRALLCRLPLRQRRQRQPEGQAVAGLVERGQRRFGIVLRVRLRAGAQGGAHAGFVGWRAGGAAVEQFVEQQRMRGQALGQQRAARGHVNQSRSAAGCSSSRAR